VGKLDIAGTTTDTGLIRTYTFSVPGSVQANNSESPVNFTVVATDAKGGVTPEGAAPTGQLLIDGIGPKVNGVTVNGGVAVASPTNPNRVIRWFARSQPGNIHAIVNIQDNGSGVDTASLTLMAPVDPVTLALLPGASRIDTAGATMCVRATAQSYSCDFTIAPAATPIGAGAQGEVNFKVAGNDAILNNVQDNVATLGIDDKKPTITFTPNYPPANADCNADANLFCGHDGNHLRRVGDGKYTLKFAVSDSAVAGDLGSGPNPSTATCSINGVPTCTVTYDASSGNFSFPADMSSATFASGVDGTGPVTVKIDAKDFVGNAATQVSVDVNVTRVKWVRKIPIAATVGAPVLTPQSGQVIVAGTVGSGDSIYSVKAVDGAIAWSAGASLSPPISVVTTNMALDTTPSTDANHPTPILYVNSARFVYSLNFSATRVEKYCTGAASASNIAGSPIVFGGGASADVVVAGGNTIAAFTTPLDVNGGPCLAHGSTSFTNAGTAQPVLGPPSANGNTIFFGYDNSADTTNDLGIKSVQFAAGSFSAPNSRNLGRQPTAGTNPAAITPAADLFFGVNNDHTFYRHAANLTPVSWSPLPLSGSQNIFSQPLVSGDLMFAMSNTLTAFRLSDASTAWVYSTALTQVSPPAIATTTFFVSNQQNQEMVAVNASDRAQRWAYRGTTATSPSTRMSSIGTEATLGSDGILYFGDSVGHLYALFVDDTPLATAAGDWPRTGYDNCNSNHSNNAGFVCQ